MNETFLGARAASPRYGDPGFHWWRAAVVGHPVVGCCYHGSSWMFVTFARSAVPAGWLCFCPLLILVCYFHSLCLCILMNTSSVSILILRFLPSILVLRFHFDIKMVIYSECCYVIFSKLNVYFNRYYMYVHANLISNWSGFLFK